MAVSTITGLFLLTAVLGFAAVVLAAAVLPVFAAALFTGLALDFLLGDGLLVS